MNAERETNSSPRARTNGSLFCRWSQSLDDVERDEDDAREWRPIARGPRAGEGEERSQEEQEETGARSRPGML